MPPSPELAAAARPEAPVRRALHENPVAWAVLFVAYVGLGMALKSVVLNWIVGPLFPLLFLYLLPRALGRHRTDS